MNDGRNNLGFTTAKIILQKEIASCSFDELFRKLEKLQNISKSFNWMEILNETKKLFKHRKVDKQKYKNFINLIFRHIIYEEKNIHSISNYLSYHKDIYELLDSEIIEVINNNNFSIENQENFSKLFNKVLQNKEDITHVIQETSPEEVFGTSFIQKIFFLFDSLDIGSFLAMLSKSSKIQEFINNLGFVQFSTKYSSFFQNLKIKHQKIIQEIDIPELRSLNETEIELLLRFLFQLHKKLEYDNFFGNWENIESQIVLMTFFVDRDENFKFWKNNLFLNKIIDLETNTSKEYKILIDKLMREPHYLLEGLLRINEPKRMITRNAASKYFYSSENKLKYEIWEEHQKDLIWLSLHYDSDDKINNLINHIPKDLILNFCKTNDLEFNIDLAIHSAFNEQLNLLDFLQTIKGSEKLFLKHVVENNLDYLNDNILISVFNFFTENFHLYKTNVKQTINDFYQSIIQKKPYIDKFNFEIKQIRITELNKIEFSQFLSEYFEENINSFNIIQKFSKFDQSKQEIIIYIMLDEIQNLDQSYEIRLKFVQLISLLVNSKAIGDDLISSVFRIIISFMEDKNNNENFQLFSEFITKIINHLEAHCMFGSRILQSENFREKNPKLYNSVKERIDSYVFQEFVDESPPILLHPKIQAFSKLSVPPARTIKGIRSTITEDINMCIDRYGQHLSYIAQELVSYISDSPSVLLSYINVLNNNKMLREFVLRASSYFIHSAIMNPHFVDEDNECIRIKAANVGRLIGLLTLAQNKFLPNYIFDIKKYLYYSLSTGKLYGTIFIISSILSEASNFFNPPNPYISGILCLLGSISIIPSMKYSIVICINSLLMRFGVRTSQMYLISDLYPDNTSHNYDFLTKPFSFGRLFSEDQINRIINFKQNILFAFISKYLRESKTIPKGLHPDALRSKLIMGIYSYIKLESIRISNIVEGTAKEQIRIESKFTNSSLNLTEHANIIIYKFIPALISQKIIFNFDNTFTQMLKQMIGPTLEREWIDDTININKEWVTSTIREIAINHALKALKDFISKLDLPEQSENIPYDFVDFPDYSSPIQEIQIDSSSNLEFDSFLSDVSNEVENAISMGYYSLQDLPATSKLEYVLYRLPPLTDVDSTLISFFYWFCQSSSKFFIQCLIFIFHRTFSKVSPSKETQRLCVNLLSTRAVPSECLVALVQRGFLAHEEVNDLIVRIFNSQSLFPIYSEMIFSFVDEYVGEQVPIGPYLKTVFLSSFCYSGKRRTIKIRDKYLNYDKYIMNSQMINETQKEILITGDITPTMAKWNNYLTLGNETALFKLTKQMLKNTKDFFTNLFIKATEKEIIQFLKYLNFIEEFRSQLSNAFKALSLIVPSNQEIYPKIFKIYKHLIKYSVKDSNALASLVETLHSIRPLKCPQFTFFWLDLIASPPLLISLASVNYSWSLLQLLIIDAECVAIRSQNIPSYHVIYKAVLRLLLVIAHDFPDFICSSVNQLISIIPFNFVQLRNVILAVTPNIPQIDPLVAEFKIDKIPDVHQISYPVISSISLLSPIVGNTIEKLMEPKDSFVVDQNDFDIIMKAVSESYSVCSNIISACFEVTFSPRLGSAPKLPFRSLPVFNIFGSLVVKSPEYTKIIECFADQLRYPSRNTHFFAKLIIELYSMNLSSVDGSSISNAIAAVLVRRAMTAPIPWGVQVVITELLMNKELGMWELLQDGDDDVKALLRAILISIGDIYSEIP